MIDALMLFIATPVISLIYGALIWKGIVKPNQKNR
jgi:hypothetical protein